MVLGQLHVLLDGQHTFCKIRGVSISEEQRETPLTEVQTLEDVAVNRDAVLLGHEHFELMLDSATGPKIE